MAFEMPLAEMSLADKLEAMELLWADLSKTPQDIPSPEWHGAILEERRRLVAEGKLKFVDMETAFARLKEQFRASSPS